MGFLFGCLLAMTGVSAAISALLLFVDGHYMWKALAVMSAASFAGVAGIVLEARGTI